MKLNASPVHLLVVRTWDTIHSATQVLKAPKGENTHYLKSDVFFSSPEKLVRLQLCLRPVMFDFSCASACNPPNPSANTVKERD